MNCPHCGSPVMVYSNSWECGWCGDSGLLLRHDTVQEKAPQVTWTLSFTWDLDLDKTWKELKQAVRKLTGSNSAVPVSMLGKVVVHEISLGMVRAETNPTDARLKKIKDFLYNTKDLNVKCNMQDLIGTAKCGKTLYSNIGVLSEHQCGDFWRSLMQSIPTHEYYAMHETGVGDIYSNLADCFALGFSEDGSGSFNHKFEIEDNFERYWGEYALMNPDVHFAKSRLQSADLSTREDYCKEILIGSFPEKFLVRTIDEVEYLSWEDAVKEEWATNPESAIKMWRALLDAAGEGLKNAAVAKELLPNFIDREWLKDSDSFHLQPLLDALKDEKFAVQIFQSAYVYSIQLDILRACNHLERAEQGEKLYHLLMKNSLPKGRWGMPPEKYADGYERGLSGRRKVQFSATKRNVDDNAIYDFCMVKTDKGSRIYSYLAGNCAVHVGDKVEVPFGKDESAIIAEVVEVRQCKAANAPWPPEQTKTIFKVVQ